MLMGSCLNSESVFKFFSKLVQILVMLLLIIPFILLVFLPLFLQTLVLYHIFFVLCFLFFSLYCFSLCFTPLFLYFLYYITKIYSISIIYLQIPKIVGSFSILLSLIFIISANFLSASLYFS